MRTLTVKQRAGLGAFMGLCGWAVGFLRTVAAGGPGLPALEALPVVAASLAVAAVIGGTVGSRAFRKFGLAVARFTDYMGIALSGLVLLGPVRIFDIAFRLFGGASGC